MANTPKTLSRAVSDRRTRKATPRWRSLFALIAILTLALASPPTGKAQTNTVISNYPGATGYCSPYDCCYHFTFKVTQTGTTCFTIVLTPQSTLSNPICLNWICLQNQIDSLFAYLGYPPYSVTYTPLSGTQTASFSICMTSGTFPLGSFDLYLCGSISCVQGWDNFYWYDNLGNGTYNNMPLPEAWMCSTPVPCSGCNNISVQDNGCWVDICIQDNVSIVSSVVLHFFPGLVACNFSNPTGGTCPVSNLTPPTGWGYSWDPVTKDLMLYNTGGPPLTNCQTLCVSIPKCNGTSQTVTLLSPYPVCPGSTITPAMKKSQPGANGGAPGTWTAINNYPNPVDASSGFKTTIPFTTTRDGTAYIRIMNEKGEEVLLDNEEVTYAGPHFFYISAERLPSGMYYYQIEFPKGEVIVSRTMLVVK